jgi:Domain of unknown function (DUF4411)
MPIYWIDAVVLIQSSNTFHPFDRVPKFWSFISQQLDAGVIKAPKIVWQEVADGNDWLAQWVQQRREKGLCVAASKSVQAYLGPISAHVVGKYKPHQANEFLKGGDPWVIAHAMDSEGIVVTQESPRSIKAKVKIPTVCKSLGVRCIDTFAMLKELGAKF